MRLRRRLSEYMIVLVLPAVFWLFTNAIVNMHVHVLPDGYMIAHAHPHEKVPFGSDPSEKHNHTRAELILYSIISEPSAVVVTLLLLGILFLTVKRIFKIYPRFVEPAREFYQVNNYHAPPFQ